MNWLGERLSDENLSLAVPLLELYLRYPEVRSQIGSLEDEVRKAIAYSIGEHEIGLQTRMGRVLEYARAVYSAEGMGGVSNYARFIRDVTPDHIKKAVQTYLDPKLLRIAIVRGTKR